MSIQLISNEFIPTQREDIRKKIDQILDDFMEPLVNATIIREIKSIAEAANIPKGFIEGVKFKKTGKNIGVVINTWGNEKTPLAKYFNYGTTQHWIEPVNKKALAWQGKSGRNASAIYFQSGDEDGTKFSKGHYVSGVPKTEAMERGYNIGKKALGIEAGRIIERELIHVN
jgi:hypothetical protein